MQHKNENLRSRAFALPLALVVTLGCGSSDTRPPPAEPRDHLDLSSLNQYDSSQSDIRDIFAVGGCIDGEIQVCRIYLPSHNDIQPCFVGEQVCIEGEWSDCGDGVLVDANDGDAELTLDGEAP